MNFSLNTYIPLYATLTAHFANVFKVSKIFGNFKLLNESNTRLTMKMNKRKLKNNLNKEDATK